MECSLSDVLSEEGVTSDLSENYGYSPTEAPSKKKREVTLCTVDKKKETLVITTVHKKKLKRKQVLKPEKGLYKNKFKTRQDCKNLDVKDMIMTERIVPNCYRVMCDSSIQKGRRIHKQNNRSRRKKLNRTSIEVKKKSKHSLKINKKKIKSHKELSMSPISLSSSTSETKGQCQISYEDVSSDSFTSCSDSELDTLIKRTKQREKHMPVSSSFLNDKPLHTSTPHLVIDLSSEDTVDSKGNISIDSQATVIIGPGVQDPSCSPISSPSCDAGSLQLDDKDTELNSAIILKQNPSELITDDRPEITNINNNEDSHLIYYHYYNVSNGGICDDIKIEHNNNNIYTEQHIFHSKESHNS